MVQAAIQVGETMGVPARCKSGVRHAAMLARPDGTLLNPLAVVFLALAMSTDAFAAAVGKGSALRRPRWGEALRTGLIFGVIEAITPIVGWALGYSAADYVKSWDHWIAFTLLTLLGGRMIVSAFRSSARTVDEKPASHSFWVLAMTGFATSIDAMAVGVGLALVDINIFPIAAAIGSATFVMVTIGVMVGRVLGKLAGRWAEATGGVVLIGIGAVILYGHLAG